MTVEQEALTALLTLVAAGFRTFVIGNPAEPDGLVYVRVGPGFRDMIRVYGPDECEAVRMVHQHATRQVDGTTPEVVAAVLGWTPYPA